MPLFTDDSLALAANHARATAARAAELGINPELLAMVEHAGGSAVHAQQVHDAAVAADVTPLLLLLHVTAIAFEAPVTPALVPPPAA